MGLRRLSEKRREEILEENKKINSELGRFKDNVPINEMSRKVLALDNVASHLVGNKRSLGFLGGSYQGGGSFLTRFKMTFYNLFTVMRGGGVQTNGGFLSQVGNQSADDFVRSSMGLLLNNDLNSSLGRIFAGMARGGVKAGLDTLTKGGVAKLAAGVLGGPTGWMVTAASFLKKFFGKAGGMLGPGIKSKLGDGFDKAGKGLIAAALGLGTLLSSIGGLGIGTAVASTAGTVVGVGAASWFVYNQYIIPTEMVSGLVSARKECNSAMEEVNNGKKT